jgi:hypothetical protein
MPLGINQGASFLKIFNPMADVAFSLILGPDPESFRDRDLRGFCLFILEIFFIGLSAKNPLKYYICHCVYKKYCLIVIYSFRGYNFS